MKGYLVIFIVLLVVLGCNDSEPKQVAFYYKNSICGYDVQGVAFQDSIDRDYCNIILTFRNKVIFFCKWRQTLHIVLYTERWSGQHIFKLRGNKYACS